jgi:hypothetical protein
MVTARGEAKQPPLRVSLDRRIKLEFHGTRINADGGLLAYRELDDALGRTAMTAAPWRRGLRGLPRCGSELDRPSGNGNQLKGASASATS